jgi:hypothetical protein
MKQFWDDITTEVTHVMEELPGRIPRQDVEKIRIDNLDIARGIAISLMVLSHTVTALNYYTDIPSWGLVPVHLITKFASSMFITIFGITLAVFYVPAYDSDDWPKKRNRLLWRAFNVLLWYKILTWVQMFQTYPKEEVTKALLFERFTDYAEVLNFYWPAMIWIVLLIPFWARWSWHSKMFFILILAFTGVLLHDFFDFFGFWQLKAMLVEYPGTFCYGQFQRGALALFGMLLGGLLVVDIEYGSEGRIKLGLISIGLAITAGITFYFLTDQSTEYRQEILSKIAQNWGKHPPNLEFMALSIAGAYSLLGFCMFIPRTLTFLFKPFSLIGKEPFFCFNLHLILIFIVFRYIMNLKGAVSYHNTLLIFVSIFIITFLLAPINTWIKRKGVLFKWLLP